MTDPKKGDHVTWKSHGSTAHGVVEKKQTSPTTIKGHKVAASPENPEFVGLVRDGDAVLMPGGYHPNVAAPGHSINFIWMMAAHREQEDRHLRGAGREQRAGKGRALLNLLHHGLANNQVRRR